MGFNLGFKGLKCWRRLRSDVQEIFPDVSTVHFCPHLQTDAASHAKNREFWANPLSETQIIVSVGIKDLGTLISNDNSVQKEIQRRILAGSRTYFAAISLFRNRHLSRATKIRLYKRLIRPVVTYGAETWTVTKKEEQAVLIFEWFSILLFLTSLSWSSNFMLCTNFFNYTNCGLWLWNKGPYWKYYSETVCQCLRGKY